MARISANIAAFALIALSIGFNMWQYPAVWDMVGGSPCLSLASESAQPKVTAESKPSAAPTVALQAADVSENYERHEFGDRHDPCEVAPSAGYALAAEQGVTFAPEAPDVELVPVVRSGGDFGDALHAELDRHIVHLPPIDREALTSSNRSVGQLPTYRIYPTTGL